MRSSNSSARLYDGKDRRSAHLSPPVQTELCILLRCLPRVLLVGFGNSFIRCSHPEQYTPLLSCLRNHKHPQPSHTLRQIRKYIMICFSGLDQLNYRELAHG